MGTDPTIVNKIKGLTGPVPVVSLYTFYMFYTAIPFPLHALHG